MPCTGHAQSWTRLLERVAHGIGPVAGVDLGEGVVDVRLHRRLLDEEGSGDLRVAQPVCDQPQYVDLAAGEAVGEDPAALPLRLSAGAVGRGGGGRRGARRAERGGQPAGHLGVQRRLSVGRVADGHGDLFPVGVLGQVAAGAGRQDGDDRLVVGVGGQGQHRDVRVLGEDPRGRLGTAHPRHPHVHQHHVRGGFTDRPHRLHPVAGSADHLHVVHQIEQGHQALADDLLVVDHQYAHAHRAWRAIRPNHSRTPRGRVRDRERTAARQPFSWFPIYLPAHGRAPPGCSTPRVRRHAPTSRRPVEFRGGHLLPDLHRRVGPPRPCRP